MNLYDLRTRAKNGNAADSYSQLSSLDLSGLTPGDKENAGWIIFYFIKQSDLERTKEALEKYISMDSLRPSMLHSNILRLVAKQGNLWSEFDTIEYIYRLGASFRDEDYDSTYFRDNEIPALVESVFSDCYDKGMDFRQALNLFRRPDHTEVNENTMITSLYAKCIYRKLWQYNKEEDDEIKSYTLVHKYLEETEEMPRRGIMHSNILNSIIWDTHDETTGWFKEIFEKWGMDSFRKEDWAKPRKGDDIYDSLAEKAIGKYIQALKVLRQSPASQFRSLISKALTYYPEDETYLRYDAKYKLESKDISGAAATYRRLILTNSKYYLWSELADILPDINQKIGCLSKAILMQRDDNFLGNIRLALAALLLDKKMFAEACSELNTFESTYRHNNWKIKNEYHILKSKIPHETIPSTGNIALYHEYERYADEFIYAEIPMEEVLLVGHKNFESNGKQKKRLLMLSHDGMIIEVNPRNFGLYKGIKNKTLYQARMDRTGRHTKIVWIKECGEIQYHTGTIDNINHTKSCFHITGEALSIVARLDRTGFTPVMGGTVRIALFRITKPDGKRYNRIIDIIEG